MHAPFFRFQHIQKVRLDLHHYKPITCVAGPKVHIYNSTVGPLYVTIGGQVYYYYYYYYYYYTP